MFVSHAQQSHCSEVRARRLAADEQSIGTELFRRMVNQPAGRGLTVVRTGGVWVLWRETVVDAYHCDVARVDNELVELIHHLW